VCGCVVGAGVCGGWRVGCWCGWAGVWVGGFVWEVGGVGGRGRTRLADAGSKKNHSGNHERVGPNKEASALGAPHHRGRIMHPRQLTQTIPCISRTVMQQVTGQCQPAQIAHLAPTDEYWFLPLVDAYDRIAKRRPARLPRKTVPSNCICRCSRMRVRLPLHILHTQVSR